MSGLGEGVEDDDAAGVASDHGQAGEGEGEADEKASGVDARRRLGV